MPIYSYRCESCEHTQDVLQKISDLPLAVCPACGASAFKKQVTAAGFQLKGSGWYATDFRNPPAAKADAKGNSEKDAGSAEPASGEKAAQGNDSNAKEEASSTKTSEASSPASDKSSASPSPSPAPSTPSST